MTNTYYSGDWYMTISNEKSMTDDGKTYCKFDLIKNKNSFWGCPVNQIGTVEEIIELLKRWKEIDSRPEYERVREINANMIKMEDEFINILEKLN